MSKPLTTVAIKTLKEGKTISDTEENSGLRISCGKRGKTFWYRYRNVTTKKLSRVTVGHFPTMSLSEARIELQRLKQLRSTGVNLALDVSKRKQKRISSEAPTTPSVTVKTVVKDYLRDYVYKNRQLKGAKTCDSILTRLVVDTIGTRLASSITRRDVLDLINTEISKGNPRQGGVLLNELSSAFEFALLRGTVEEDFINPCVLAKNSLKVMNVSLSGKKRIRFFTSEEIAIFMDWLEQPKIMSMNHKRALRLTLQLGCRSGEAIAARWKEFNLESGTWHLPDTKTGIPRTIVLPVQVLEWLKADRLLHPKDKYLCPSPKGDSHIMQKSITESLWFKKRDGKLPEIDHWTPHDLRRTCRTHLAKLGCPSEIAEAALGHTIGGVEGVYNLHRYEREVGVWLQKWNDELDKIQNVNSLYMEI